MQLPLNDDSITESARLSLHLVLTSLVGGAVGQSCIWHVDVELKLAVLTTVVLTQQYHEAQPKDAWDARIHPSKPVLAVARQHSAVPHREGDALQ